MGLQPEFVVGTRRALRLLALLGPALVIPLLDASEGWADTIHLKNGRAIEGRIVDQDETSVTIEVPAHPDPIEARLRAPIVNRILRRDIARMEVESRSYAPQEEVETGRRVGLANLYYTLPPYLLTKWTYLMDRYDVPEKVVLCVVMVIILILLPALLLHAGSSIVTVTDPTYSRALLCIILIAGYTFVFIWLTNLAGLLTTLDLTAESAGHLAVLVPLYLLGQAAIYKWTYVATWGKASGLVLVGLLVALITGTGFWVFLTILAG